jgi:hypothetical protein
MATTWQMDVTEAFVYVRVLGTYAGADDTLAGMSTIAEQCRAAQCWRVLLDLTSMIGSIPQLDRFLLGTRAARIWGQRLRVAILARPQEINHFFENVATNNGANVRVFADREAAQAWLRTSRLVG